MTSCHRTDDVLLRIDKVSLSLGGRLILRDISVDITRNDVAGEVICFLGPSGVGKTQLSRIIAGLQQPTSGEVLLRDCKPTGPGRVCMVPQAYPMFEYMTVLSNLIVAGRQSDMDAKARIEVMNQLIATFGLKEHLLKYPRQLSGGTKQRVAIARQLMCASDYIVMDEPFSGLDISMKRHATEAIIQLSKLGTYKTIVVVTHDVTEGMSVADRVWVMGHEQDANGEPIEGARLVQDIDLAVRGLAWRPDIIKDPEFIALTQQVKDMFETLK